MPVQLWGYVYLVGADFTYNALGGTRSRRRVKELWCAVDFALCHIAVDMAVSSTPIWQLDLAVGVEVPLRNAFKKLGNVLAASASLGTCSMICTFAPGKDPWERVRTGRSSSIRPTMGQVPAQTIAGEVVPMDDLSTISQVDLGLVDDSGRRRTCSMALSRRKLHVVADFVPDFLSSGYLYEMIENTSKWDLFFCSERVSR
jgi:hypothetical protein